MNPGAFLSPLGHLDYCHPGVSVLSPSLTPSGSAWCLVLGRSCELSVLFLIPLQPVWVRVHWLLTCLTEESQLLTPSNQCHTAPCRRNIFRAHIWVPFESHLVGDLFLALPGGRPAQGERWPGSVVTAPRSFPKIMCE